MLICSCFLQPKNLFADMQAFFNKTVAFNVKNMSTDLRLRRSNIDFSIAEIHSLFEQDSETMAYLICTAFFNSKLQFLYGLGIRDIFALKRWLSFLYKNNSFTNDGWHELIFGQVDFSAGDIDTPVTLAKKILNTIVLTPAFSHLQVQETVKASFSLFGNENSDLQMRFYSLNFNNIVEVPGYPEFLKQFYTKNDIAKNALEVKQTLLKKIDDMISESDRIAVDAVTIMQDFREKTASEFQKINNVKKKTGLEFVANFATIPMSFFQASGLTRNHFSQMFSGNKTKLETNLSSSFLSSFKNRLTDYGVNKAIESGFNYLSKGFRLGVK
jgi:hypothetical protein